MKSPLLQLLSALAIIIIVLCFSCQKTNKIEDNNNIEEVGLDGANFSSEFNWESTKVITIIITSDESKILNITSTDKLIRYHKAKLHGNSKTYTVKISVPSDVEQISINEEKFDLKSSTIIISL